MCTNLAIERGPHIVVKPLNHLIVQLNAILGEPSCMEHPFGLFFRFQIQGLARLGGHRTGNQTAAHSHDQVAQRQPYWEEGGVPLVACVPGSSSYIQGKVLQLHPVHGFFFHRLEIQTFTEFWKMVLWFCNVLHPFDPCFWMFSPEFLVNGQQNQSKTLQDPYVEEDPRHIFPGFSHFAHFHGHLGVAAEVATADAAEGGRCVGRTKGSLRSCRENRSGRARRNPWAQPTGAGTGYPKGWSKLSHFNFANWKITIFLMGKSTIATLW